MTIYMCINIKYICNINLSMKLFLVLDPSTLYLKIIITVGETYRKNSKKWVTGAKGLVREAKEITLFHIF